MTERWTESSATLRLVASEVIFGTLGLFVRLIPLSSEALAASRGILGALFLLVFMRLRGLRLELPQRRRTMALLLVSGVCLTLNWAFLFEAYRLTTLATAELAYEMAPVIVMAVSPFVLNEHLTGTRKVCLCLALAGIVAVSGVLEPGATVGVTIEGVALGLVAACFYASVMVLNQFLGSVEPLTKTAVQLGVAGLALVPRLAVAGEVGWLSLGPREWLLLMIVCLVHTGVAFILWFSSLHELSAQKVAIFNYIDPAVALLVSALVFGERLTPLATVGAVLILGSTLASELLEMDADAS
ncbi:MAG: EamA family transporter [Atopobiaceae bacterium]|nr:EamA family transporter [Atopobiaceae bacterium]